MNKIFFPIIFSVALFMYGCVHDPILPGDGYMVPVDTTQAPCDSTIIYFENQIMPMIASNCAVTGCHDPITAEDGVILNSYENIITTGDIDAFDPGGSDLYEVLIETDPDKKMPPPSSGNSLSQEQIDLIYNWILQGAENNFCDNSQAPCEDTLNVSWALFVFPNIQHTCLGCHNNTTANGGIILETHADVQPIALDGTLWGALDHEAGFVPMPKDQPKLDYCTLKKIKSWIDAGAPNN